MDAKKILSNFRQREEEKFTLTGRQLIELFSAANARLYSLPDWLRLVDEMSESEEIPEAVSDERAD